MATKKQTKTFSSKATKILLTLLLLAFSTSVFSGGTYEYWGDKTEKAGLFARETTNIYYDDLTIKDAGMDMNRYSKVIVHGDLILEDAATICLDIWKYAELIVMGDLILKDGAKMLVQKDAKPIEIYGNLILEDNAKLEIEEGGKLSVAHDLKTYNNPEFILHKNSKILIGKNLEVVGKTTMGCPNIYHLNWKLKKVWENPESSVYVQGTNVNGSSISRDRVNIYGNKLSQTDKDYMQDLKGRAHENALPITLINFEAETFSDYNHLQWATASESNNDYFTIYKSTDGVNWEWFTEVTSENSNSSIRTDYEFIDNNVEYGITYYKLEQTDFDGTTETSKVISVEANVEKSDFVITKNGINVTFANPNEQQTVTITSAQGRVLYKKSFTGVYDAFIETNNLTKGVYIVSSHTSKGVISRNFVK